MNVRKIMQCILMLATCGIVTACASIVDGGPTKPISVSSAEIEKAFIVKDAVGDIVYEGRTPSIVHLERKGEGWFEKQHYTISFEDGSSPVKVSSKVTGWYVAGNIALGGLVGWLLVDPATGAMYTLKPKKVHLGTEVPKKL